MSSREATCSCGQLRVTTTGEPLDVTMCHCLACQHRTGTVVAVQALYKQDHVRAEGRYSEYIRVRERGDERRYCFCPDCGATVFFTVPAVPDLVGIPVGGFADPSFPAPRISVYESRRHPWLSVPDSVERRD